jgi:hypothetical protein
VIPALAFLRTPDAALRVGLTPATLEKLRVIGGGPPFYRVGPKRILYDPADLDSWVRAKKFASTSQRIAPASDGDARAPRPKLYSTSDRGDAV